MSFGTMIADLGEVLLAGLVLGAGLPALFALGIRLAAGPGQVSEDDTIVHGADASPVAKTAAYLCFAIIIAAIIAGILWITKATIFQYTGLDVFGTEA